MGVVGVEGRDRPVPGRMRPLAEGAGHPLGQYRAVQPSALLRVCPPFGPLHAVGRIRPGVVAVEERFDLSVEGVGARRVREGEDIEPDGNVPFRMIFPGPGGGQRWRFGVWHTHVTRVIESRDPHLHAPIDRELATASIRLQELLVKRGELAGHALERAAPGVDGIAARGDPHGGGFDVVKNVLRRAHISVASVAVNPATVAVYCSWP